jgi:hypothetical protein
VRSLLGASSRKANGAATSVALLGPKLQAAALLVDEHARNGKTQTRASPARIEGVAGLLEHIGRHARAVVTNRNPRAAVVLVFHRQKHGAARPCVNSVVQKLGQDELHLLLVHRDVGAADSRWRTAFGERCEASARAF